MLFHPILNQIANLDMAFLVKPADEQRIEGQTACFCPLCQKEEADDGEQGKAKQTPHLIIYNNERGGMYNGVGVEDNSKAEHGALRWMCTKTGKYGYGALELYAAMRKLPMHGASLLRLCHDLIVRVYGDNEKTRAKWPMLFAKMDYRTIAPQTIETFSFMPKTDFNPQELAALGCEVTSVKGIPQYGFGKDFNTKMLNEDFRIYAVDQVTLPNVVRNGQLVSEVIYGTPWNPLFVCFATDVIAPQGSCGCFFRPAIQQDPIVFSTCEEHSVRKVSKWLMGDPVFVHAAENRTAENTAVYAAIKKYQPDEVYTEEKEIWVENLDKDDQPKGTFHTEKVDIPVNEIKAQNIVFCRTPEDALSVYYAMQSLRKDKAGDKFFEKNSWFHVAFSIGRGNFWYIERGEWRQEKLDFSGVQYQKMKRFAERVIMIYPNDITSQRNCGAIATKFSDICYAMLPESFRVRYNQRWQWLYGCTPRSVRDYMLTYRMSDEDNFRFDHDIRLPLFSKLRGAKNTDPFEIEYPRDPRSGKPKPCTCKISPTKVWLFMTSHGYYRKIEPESNDLVGQFIHLDRCFVEYIDGKSIIQATKEKLLEFCEQSWRHNEQEQKLMSDCANLIDKNFSEKSAGGLQSIVIDFTEGYSENIEYFYFRNVALKITPEYITPISYDQCNFFIPATARKPYDFTMRHFDPPFIIKQSDEYTRRENEIAQKEAQKNEDGSPVFSIFEISQMKNDLREWGTVYRWDVDWRGKKDRELWPMLRILRGCSNVLWQEEMEADRSKHELSEEDKSIINAHFVNMVSGIGRVCYRDLSGTDSQSIPYLLEDQIEDEKQASGGSGKSMVVRVFVGSAVNVLNIDMKRFITTADARFSLGEIQHNPGMYRAIHWEDRPKSFPMDYFYVMATTGVTLECKGADIKTLSLKDSPLHIVSSNFPYDGGVDSTAGRFPQIAFSNRFARENTLKRKMARSPGDILKGFNPDPEKLPDIARNQAIYITALAVQFMMRYHVVSKAPQLNLRRRNMISEITESCVRYFEFFFSRKEVYGVPICADEMFNEFIRDWADASEGKSKEYSRATFKKKIHKYCESANIKCNPEHLFENVSDKQRNCFKMKAWVTQEYFVGREWENDNTIEPKFIRYIQTSKHVFFFYRPGRDTIPTDYAELKRIAKEFAEAPDPLPYRDDDGNIVQLTQEEEDRWNAYQKRKQGRFASAQNAQNSSTEATVDSIDKDTLPF